MITKTKLNEIASDVFYEKYNNIDEKIIFNILSKYTIYWNYEDGKNFTKVENIFDTEEDNLLKNIITFLVKKIDELEDDIVELENDKDEIETENTYLQKELDNYAIESENYSSYKMESVLDVFIQEDINKINHKLTTLSNKEYVNKLNLILQILDN